MATSNNCTGPPLIVFCTTCKGRLAHLRETLPKNIEDNADYPNCKFVVLDYCDNGELENYLRCYEASLLSGHLTVYSFRGRDRFHVSHAKNLAARCGMLEGADILVTLDADNFTGPGFASYIADHFKERSFLSPNVPSIHKLPHGPLRPARGYAGRLAIRTQDFIKLGGYDEDDGFSTWRGEDTDMNTRLMNLDYKVGYIPNRFLNAIPHNAAVRFAEYPEAIKYEDKHEIKVLTSRKDTVVNYGKFGMGKVFRNFDFTRPIELKGIPTRVFGIGLHKTATTSLHRAFQVLGLDSLHWGHGEAPRIWHEMNNFGRSKTLEQFYAISDLPIPLLYQKLDAAYPGSKFILTVRDEAEWLLSVSRLWDARYNPTRWVWDVYPFTNRIHTELYGQKTFDGKVFLNRYRRHNAEVMEYFKNRPDDFIVMGPSNMEWSSLCPFLNVPVPEVPYPREYVTKSAASE